ncbi:MAG: xanthine dehydrogenase family protein subunit M [Planctomycetota bacterium]|jgi:carbon-monoxide dehydrogenase medium subunit|nr:carbon monoxide dehydrogenase [Candidatus Woesearchaeota archaeon]MDP6386491.1 xanthine dehydrogenase family protein subunit M [Planctomycetota bacterium]
MTTHTYLRPTCIEEALQLASQHPGARFVAGGTDLMVQSQRGRVSPETLVSLRRVDELGQISWADGQLRIGAAVPLASVAQHEQVLRGFHALGQSIAVVGSPQIRNVASLGGNLCNASPGADTAPALLAHGAQVELVGPAGPRTLDLTDFFLGPGSTALQEGEILTAVLLQEAPGSSSAFLRKGRVRMDLAIASAAVQLDVEDDVCRLARIAVGAVAPTPLRLLAAEACLTGQRLDGDAVNQAASAVADAIAPISDLRASREYRLQLTPVLVRRALNACLAVGGRES